VTSTDPDEAAGGRRRTVHRDGVDWPLGTAADVAWIAAGTTIGREITSGVPPVFEAYATIVLPESDEDQERHDGAVIQLLRGGSGDQPWWLGFLETGNSDVVFAQAPRVGLYGGGDWPYVIVEAGPDQARSWREFDHWKGRLPDLIFPVDRSWLYSTLWDDDWTCLGGPRGLVGAFLADAELGPRVREVQLGEDATPPGHTAF
jgi:hypothetical protein